MPSHAGDRKLAKDKYSHEKRHVVAAALEDDMALFTGVETEIEKRADVPTALLCTKHACRADRSGICRA
jgi:hypothetical protein